MIKSVLKCNRITPILALLSLLALSCDKDFLDDKPNDAYPLEPITTVNNMERVLNGAYSAIQSATTFGRNIFVLPDLIADNEFVSDQNSGRFLHLYRHSWLYDNGVISDLWSDLYTLIARVNLVIDKTGIAPSDLSESDQKLYNQYLGEAYALRAMAHFALVNFFAASPHTRQNTPGIPYVTELVDPDHPLDFDTPRLSLQETYQRIEEADLNQALQLMNRERGKVYLGPVAVQLLLSRLYLYGQQYDKAIAAADQAISSGPKIVTQAGYVGYWKKELSGVETVFEIEQDDTDSSGPDSYSSILHKGQGGGYGQNLAYDDLVQAMGTGDVRQKLFEKVPDDESRTDNPPGWYVNKYTSVNGSYTRNLKLLRISEAYLNKIEAEYHTAPTAAAQDLTKFATFRYAVNYSAAAAVAVEKMTDIRAEIIKSLAK